MQAIGVRILNVALLGVCCFFAVQWVVRLGGPRDALEFGESLRSAIPLPAAAPPRDDHEGIVDRNLFGAEIDAAAAEVPLPDPAAPVVGATRLPLQLLGTLVADPQALSEAVILDTRENQHMVVGLGDPLAFHPDVKVYRIEPRRVLLESDRGIEELLLEAGPGRTGLAAETPPQRRDAGPAEKRPLRSTVELARQRDAGVRSEILDAMDRMAAHFANDIEPAYDASGKIEGVRVVNLSEGGLLQEAGVTRDDLIEGVNGVKITSADGAQRVLRDLASCQPMTGMIVGPQGERTVEITTEMLKKFDCVE